MIKDLFNGKFSWPKFIIFFLIIWLITFFAFKDQIKETKVYKAKMGVLKALIEGEDSDNKVEKLYEHLDTTFSSNKQK